jgi:hypothetical protein
MEGSNLMRYFYSNNGLSFRVVDDAATPNPGEVEFDAPPTAQQLATAFLSYETALNAQAAQLAFNAAAKLGVTVTSTAYPAVSATYAIDKQSLANVTSEQVYLATANRFTNGQASRAWLDINGAPHVIPSPAVATQLFEAIALYYDSLLTALATAQATGAPFVAPSNTASIP